MNSGSRSLPHTLTGRACDVARRCRQVMNQNVGPSFSATTALLPVLRLRCTRGNQSSSGKHVPPWHSLLSILWTEPTPVAIGEADQHARTLTPTPGCMNSHHGLGAEARRTGLRLEKVRKHGVICLLCWPMLVLRVPAKL